MKKYKNLFFENKNIPLSTIPFHSDVSFLERYFAEGFPMHLAIHKIDEAHPLSEQYTLLHSHDVPEVNIIIGNAASPLVYMIQLGDELYKVKSNVSIWIPAGLPHSTNVIKGSGFYIAMRLDLSQPNLGEILEVNSISNRLVEEVEINNISNEAFETL